MAHLEMDKSRVGQRRTTLCQTFVDDGVRTLGIQLDLAVGHSYDGRHSLSGRIEFADVENLELGRLATYIDKDRFRFSGLEHDSSVFRPMYLVRTEMPLTWKRYPNSSAPDTNAASSGLEAW